MVDLSVFFLFEEKIMFKNRYMRKILHEADLCTKAHAKIQL